MTTKEKILVMQAFEDGEEIECIARGGEWRTTPSPNWSWGDTSYRIKPKPVRYEAMFRTNEFPDKCGYCISASISVPNCGTYKVTIEEVAE